MKPFLLQPAFWIPAILVAINESLAAADLQPGWMASYLNDLCALPLMLSIALLFQRHVTYRNPGYVFRWQHLMFACLYVSLAFEFFLPMRSEQYVADYWDTVCYALGTLYFAFFLNKPSYRRPFVPNFKS